MTNALTPTEEKVYQYLIEFLAANSYQPSIREIGRQFDIKSTKTVSDVLGNLARKGYIQRNQARSRGLRILAAHGSTSRQLPYFRQVSAFGPPASPDTRTDSVIIDRRLAPGEDSFFARVADDAMATVGVRRDATILVSPDVSPADGDLVAVRVDLDVVVRTFEHHGDVVWLAAAEPGVKPIQLLAGDDPVVLGVVHAVFRHAIESAAEAAAAVTADVAA